MCDVWTWRVRFQTALRAVYTRRVRPQISSYWLFMRTVLSCISAIMYWEQCSLALRYSAGLQCFSVQYHTTSRLGALALTARPGVNTTSPPLGSAADCGGCRDARGILSGTVERTPASLDGMLAAFRSASSASQDGSTSLTRSSRSLTSRKPCGLRALRWCTATTLLLGLEYFW